MRRQRISPKPDVAFPLLLQMARSTPPSHLPAVSAAAPSRRRTARAPAARHTAIGLRRRLSSAKGREEGQFAREQRAGESGSLVEFGPRWAEQSCTAQKSPSAPVVVWVARVPSVPAVYSHHRYCVGWSTRAAPDITRTKERFEV